MSSGPWWRTSLTFGRYVRPNDSHPSRRGPQWPEPGPFLGRAAFARFLEEWSGAWEEPRLEVDRVEERNDAAIAECPWIVSGASSGAAVPTAFTVVARFGPDGQANRIAAFLDHDEALRSVRSARR
jgi:hypothetical protein